MGASTATVTAFRCQVVDGELLIKLRTTLQQYCMKPEAAVVTLSTGEAVTVASSDMMRLRALLGVREVA
jgi:hypothetical protein